MIAAYPLTIRTQVAGVICAESGANWKTTNKKQMNMNANKSPETIPPTVSTRMILDQLAQLHHDLGRARKLLVDLAAEHPDCLPVLSLAAGLEEPIRKAELAVGRYGIPLLGAIREESK